VSRLQKSNTMSGALGHPGGNIGALQKLLRSTSKAAVPRSAASPTLAHAHRAVRLTGRTAAHRLIVERRTSSGRRNRSQRLIVSASSAAASWPDGEADIAAAQQATPGGQDATFVQVVLLC